LPLELWDERMSTARALAAIWEQGGSAKGRKPEVDALAAAVLLQHFLDARRNRTEKTEGTETENSGW
jgi:putative Holliday junction resolvase